MDKERKEMLQKLQDLKQTVQMELKEKHGYEDCIVKNVIHYNKKVELVNKRTKKKEQFDLCTVIVEDSKTKQETIFYYLNGKEIDYTDLVKEYESAEPIKDVVHKTKENENKPENEQDKELKKEDLNELEEEEEKEENDNTKKKEDKQIDQKDKRKPSHVIERVNPDKAKMDYWKTVKQACGLPEKVDTLAFAYPVSSEDRVDYANITVYMLDKDGYIIDDINVDDYFEFDSSTGNNPIQDKVVKHEEDENKGKAQIEENRAMIRLKAKNSADKNTYISLEQKNGVGDYNDINAGRKTVAGTQNVEKQLETDRVRVWDSEREKIVKSNAGIFNMNEIFEEAEKHKEHGDEEYISTLNADGEENTISECNTSLIPGTDKTWDELSEETGESKEKLQDRFEREIKEGKEPEQIINEIEYDYEMVEPNRDRR